MTYYSPRCSLYYFHQMEACRRSTIPHHIVSVIGGMGWLHAVGPNMKSIYLIDTDADAIQFCRNVVSAMLHRENLESFLTRLREIVPNEHVEWTGHGLTPGKFYWHLGQFNFASPEHYAELRHNLFTAFVNIRQGDLSERDYKLPEKQFVFVSNADGPLGVNGSKIFPRVIETATSHTKYVSWLHTITIEPNPYKKNYDDPRDL